MGLKKYLFFSIVFLAVVGAYAFLTVQGQHTVNIDSLQLNVTLPIAIWVILPAALLVIATVVHILFYGFRNYLHSRAIEKDEESLINVIKDALLENNSNRSFKIKEIKEIANILSQMKLDSKVERFESSNSDINHIIDTIAKIKEGNYIYDKSLKFNKSGTVAAKNLENRIANDVDFSMDVIKKKDTYSTENVKQAFLRVVEEKSMTTVKKLLENMTLDKEMLLALIEKDANNAEFSLEEAELIKYINGVEFTETDFINLVKKYKTSMQPDGLLALCEKLSNENDAAMSAYFYILFEFEMIDQVRELLNGFGAHEFTAYRALLDLKDNGRNYTVDSLSYK